MHKTCQEFGFGLEKGIDYSLNEKNNPFEHLDCGI